MTFEKIASAFPTPTFLDIPYAGISISDNFVRCIQFGTHIHGVYVEKYAERPLSPGAIVSGEIQNPGEVVRVLQTLKKDLHLGYVKVSLPEEKAYLFTTKLPVISQKEVRGAIEFKMEENVPVPPSELTFDYVLMDHHELDHLDVVVSALPTSVVDSYVDVLNTAELPVLSLEIESEAVARALLPRGSKGTVLLVHFGIEKVGLYVASNRIVRFTSTVPIHDELGDYSAFLLDEINKIYIYWDTLKDNIGKADRKIEQIIMCGENFGEEVLLYISAHHKTPATLGNVWSNVFDINTTVPSLSLTDSLRYAPAVGLALPSHILI